jgi:hypothetical protein
MPQNFGWSYFSDRNKDSCDTGGWENFVYIDGRWHHIDDCVCENGHWVKSKRKNLPWFFQSGSPIHDQRKST